MDGDGAAAMRYTEARMSKIAVGDMQDLDKDTRQHAGQLEMAKKGAYGSSFPLPDLLVNGGQSYCRRYGDQCCAAQSRQEKVIDAILQVMANPDISVTELMQYIKGPDFPVNWLYSWPQRHPGCL